MIATARDQKTSAQTSGVMLKPGHWSSASIHSFRNHVSDREVETWCGLVADFSDGARLTTDLITCLSCSEASWKALWRSE